MGRGNPPIRQRVPENITILAYCRAVCTCGWKGLGRTDPDQAENDGWEHVCMRPDDFEPTGDE